MEKKNNNVFKDLASISIKDKVEKKGKFNYLSWASAWSLIKGEFPNAQRTVYEHEHTGLNFFSDGSTAYVKVGITINTMRKKVILSQLEDGYKWTRTRIKFVL